MKTTIDGARAASAQLMSSLERERREERETPRELWALCVANTVLAELPKLSGPPEAEPGPSPRAVASSEAPAPLEPDLDEAGEATSANTARGTPGNADVPATLSAEVSDDELGTLQLSIERAESGLDIVINVADARVKALIEADRAQLVKTLKDAGLHVASVQIGGPSRAGTGLAQERAGAEKARAGASLRQPAARWRTYTGSPAAEEDADTEGVDLTA